VHYVESRVNRNRLGILYPVETVVSVLGSGYKVLGHLPS
jgi:hypothetical protein